MTVARGAEPICGMQCWGRRSSVKHKFNLKGYKGLLTYGVEDVDQRQTRAVDQPSHNVYAEMDAIFVVDRWHTNQGKVA